MNNGNFIISLDFELLWGLAGWDNNSIATYAPQIRNSVDSVQKMLCLFKKYNIKSTIAVVGAMSFNNKDELLKNSIKPFPQYTNKQFSSYESILTLSSDYSSDMLFIPEYLDKLSSNPMVELASHTFSHYYCLERGVTKEDFERDLQAMKKLYPNLKTIVFPRNQINEELLELCFKYDFTHYRGKFEHPLYAPTKTSSRYTLKGALRFLDSYVPISGHQSFMNESDTSQSELRNIPESSFLRPYSKKMSFLERLKLRRIKKEMSFAAKNGRSYHLWWHPHNFGINQSENLSMLDEICFHYAELSRIYGFQSKFISDL